MARYIDVDGSKCRVVESLGYIHDIGLRGAIVLHDGIERKAVGGNGRYRFWTPRDRAAQLVAIMDDHFRRPSPDEKKVILQLASDQIDASVMSVGAGSDRSTSVSQGPDNAGNWTARITIKGDGAETSSTGLVRVGSLSTLLGEK